MDRKKIILYGGGAVVLIAVVLFLIGGNKSAPQSNEVQPTGANNVAFNPDLIQAQIQAAQTATNANANIAIAQIGANTEVALSLANRDVSLAAIAGDVSISRSSIDAQVNFDNQTFANNRILGLAELETQLAISRDNNSADVSIAANAGNAAVAIEQIRGNIDLSAIAAQNARDAGIIANIGQVRKKDRDNVFKTLISGENDRAATQGPSKTAQVIDSVGGLAKSVASIF